uniref:Uncharacterized protein n=1 Tax=Arundo donax TaxID=35708 RepID=A0A0A9A282_ARUDO
MLNPKPHLTHAKEDYRFLLQEKTSYLYHLIFCYFASYKRTE